MKRKLLAALLVICMVMTMAPMTAFATGGNTECPGGESCEHVAAIDNTHYDTLQDAVNAVPGDTQTTITLLRDASGNGVVVPSQKNITFDLKDCIYTIDGETVGSSGTETNGFQLLRDSDITFRNGTITSAKAKILIQNYSNLTLDNVKLDGTKLNDTVPYTLSNNFGDITIKDSAIMAHDNGYAFDVYYWPANGYTDGLSVTVERNSVITGKIEYGGDSTTGSTNVAEKASLNITGGTFTGELSLGQTGTSAKAGINISGGTFKTSTSSTWQDYVQPGMKLENGIVVIDTTTAVAKIGDVGYDTLQNAITAAKDGDTITVLKDITLTSPVTISGTNVTLDLGGKTVSNASGAVLTVASSSGVKIKNGKLFSPNTAWTPTLGVNKNATLTIAEDAVVVGPYGLGLNDHSVDGGTGVTIHVYGTVRGVNESDGTSLLNSGGTVGIGVSGNIKNTTEYATIHIYKGAVVSGSQGSSGNTNNDDGPAIYAAGYAKWIIDEGATLSGSEALSIKSGGFTINGGTFTATGTFADPATSWGNGTEATGAAISITNHNSYAKNVEMVISGGTFTSQNGYAIYENDTEAQDGSALGTDGLSITGGTFTGAASVGAVSSAHADEFISGGTFSSDLSEDDFLTDDVKYKVAHRAGTFSYAKTLADAQKLAQSGDTITELNVTPGTTTYTLTLNYNDGATANVTYTVASGTEVPLRRPTRTNYTFGGWKAANGTIYSADTSYKVTENVTLTAQWTYSGGSSGGGGSSTPTYSVSAPSSVANGTIAVSPKSASKGAKVTISATPSEGYQLDTLTVKDADGNKLTLTQISDTQYTFEMPASKVTIEASFVQEQAASGLPFTDVAETSWFYNAVKYAYDNGMMSGTGDTTFEPNANLSRSMIAQVLYNLEGKPAVSEDAFTDVTAGQWYTNAVNWAAANAIVSGYGDDTFGPNDNITREQMASILYRYAQYKKYDTTAKGDLSAFTDGAATSSWASDAMTWAVGAKLLSGKGDGILDPTGTATRAEVAQILMTFCENIA